MQPLDKSLRNRLERTIKNARDIAENAARAALEQLGVGQAAPFAHLSEQERDLRRRLRVHGRQLGDSLNGGKIQTMDRLIEEVAYEHWHRMLFARFLAENNLLMYPDPDDPVAVTLEECEDLAADEGAGNGWELAARFAARMLPQIFRLDSPVFQLALPPEHQQKLERLVADLELPVFTASDSLGWVYQFWQAKKKDEVNAAEVKIGARELPAVTQLFTEPYMVSFLLDNSLGAWWVRQCSVSSDQLSEKARNLLKTAKSEEDLRQFFSRPGISLEYLRFVKTDHCKLTTENSSILDGEHWEPAAGWFDGWPDNLSDLKTLDPCCGSGHFLVAAFLMLVPMRMELDGLSAREAVDAVLRENIHGLELDQRCVELAAFALALTAWKYPDAGGYRVLPELNVACSGLSISAKKEEWLALGGNDTNLRLVLEELYKQFKDAPVLGSLINPEASLGKGSLFELKWEEVGRLLTVALAGAKNDVKTEMEIVARGLAKAGDLLIHSYHLSFTNVPFRQSDTLAPSLNEHIKNKYPLSKADLATVFHQRILKLLTNLGVMALVQPQGFVYKDYYSKYRKKVFTEKQVPFLARLGPRAFSAINGEEVKGILSIVLNSHPNDSSFVYQIDASIGSIDQKIDSLRNSQPTKIAQINALISKKAIVLQDMTCINGKLLEEYASFSNGIQTVDYPRFGRFFWEIPKLTSEWEFQLSTVKATIPWGGREHCVYWGKGDLVQFVEEKLGEGKTGTWLRGLTCKGKKSVAISAMGELKATLYNGEIFDDNTVVLLPENEEDLNALWHFCSSSNYNSLVREIDQSNKVRGALLRVSFPAPNPDERPDIPEIDSVDPTQWIFHGHSANSLDSLQVAVARLLGYRWPAELDAGMELADEQREWVKRCEALADYADEDGIVCIPLVRGEAAASDRLLNLLAGAFGDVWSNETLAELLKGVDHAGKTLETWLREKFFTQHCKLFQHRPFIWHIWDGLRDGFAALVNYHQLDYKNLETLIYTYLGDWISRQKQDIASSVDGAQERLAAAESLKKKLELILEGEAPYDIFVRWKPQELQPLGWNPDLNDGVRLNIRPFLTVSDVGKRGAGVLRDKPNIKWTKDRGKDVESAPWFKLFGGDRMNDHHLSLEEKRTVRESRHD